MHDEDRQEIDLVQLGEMYGKVNGMDDKFESLGEKIDASSERTQEVLVEIKDTQKDHNKRISRNSKKIYWLTGIALSGGGIWEFIIK